MKKSSNNYKARLWTGAGGAARWGVYCQRTGTYSFHTIDRSQLAAESLANYRNNQHQHQRRK